MLIEITRLDNEIDQLEEVKQNLYSALTNDIFWPLLGHYHTLIFKVYKDIQNKIDIRQKQILSMISKEQKDIEQIIKEKNPNKMEYKEPNFQPFQSNLSKKEEEWIVEPTWKEILGLEDM